MKIMTNQEILAMVDHTLLKADAKKVIVITKEDNPTLSLASRNIPNVYVQTKDHLSVLDLINGDMYVMTLDAVEAYEEDLK